MPLISRSLDGGRGVIIEVRGDVDDGMYLSGIREHLALASVLPDCRFSLADFSNAERVDVSAEAIQHVAAMTCAAGRARPEFLLAQVGQSDLVYGLVRMFQLHAADLPWEMTLFRHRAEAEDWLRLRAIERFGYAELMFR